jgi:hypothetical protein
MAARRFGFGDRFAGREYMLVLQKPQSREDQVSRRPGTVIRLGGIFLGLLLSLGSVLSPTALSGQEGSFAFQMRGGVSAPVMAFRDGARGWEGGAGRGSSFGLGFTVPLPGPTGGYFGFSQHRFRCDESVCPAGEKWVSTGFDLGLRLVLGSRRLRPWLQAGLHTHRVEGRILEGVTVVDVVSDGGAGFEAGGGILVQIGNRMSLSPGLRYGGGRVSFSRQPSLRLQYLLADLGLVVGF